MKAKSLIEQAVPDQSGETQRETEEYWNLPWGEANDSKDVIFGVAVSLDKSEVETELEYPTGKAKLYRTTYLGLMKTAVEVGAKWRKGGFDYTNPITPDTWVRGRSEYMDVYPDGTTS